MLAGRNKVIYMVNANCKTHPHAQFYYIIVQKYSDFMKGNRQGHDIMIEGLPDIRNQTRKD